MKGNPFFSIIVPVYKVEQYLERCIKSVFDQTFSDYELILVDDGSPDRCGEMCDDYAEKNQRIKVVHKENGGLSSARNAGLDRAIGEYVIFLDSDDFWDDRDALKNISANVAETQPDLLVFPAKRYYEAENEYTYIINTEVNREKIIQRDLVQAITYMIENNIYRAAAWNKVIKRKIIENNALRFKENYLSEDMDWCGDLLICCKQFDYYGEAFYCYRQQRTGSITSGKTEKLVADKLYMCEKGLSQAETLGGETGRLLGAYYAYEYSVTLGVSYGIKDKQILTKMKELKKLLRYDTSNKVKKVNKLQRIVGYDLMRHALCLFVRIKR